MPLPVRLPADAPSKEGMNFSALVLVKLTNDAVSFRFLLFCLVGLTGIAVHMAVLQVAVSLGTRFGWSQTNTTASCVVADVVSAILAISFGERFFASGPFGGSSRMR